MVSLKPHHTAISVMDLDKAVEFYQKLGFQKVHRYDEQDGSMSIVHLKLGEYYLEIFHYAKNGNQDSLHLETGNNLDQVGVKHIALHADDVESTLEELINVGLADSDTKVIVGETNVKYFFIKDPDGIWVEIVNDQRYI